MEFDQLIKTAYGQSLLCCVLAIVTLIVVRPKNANAAYTITGLVYIGFIVMNSVFSFWKTDDVWSYFFMSMLITVLTLWVMSVITSAYIHIWRVEGSGESGMIFLVIMYHPFLLFVVMGTKWVYLNWIT